MFPLCNRTVYDRAALNERENTHSMGIFRTPLLCMLMRHESEEIERIQNSDQPKRIESLIAFMQHLLIVTVFFSVHFGY